MASDSQHRRKPNSRSRNFGLKTLFLVVTISGLPCGMCVKPLVAVRAERQAAAEIRGIGGRVYSHWRFDRRIKLQHRPHNHGRWHRLFLADSTVHAVYLTSCKVTDDQLVHLKALPNLENLYLGYAQVTDAMLETLRGLTRLQWLELCETRVTDARHG